MRSNHDPLTRARRRAHHRAWTGLGLLAAALASSLACADFERGAYWDPDPEGDSGDTVEDGAYSYAADVHDLLGAGCERCHGLGNSAGNTQFVILPEDLDSSYASTLVFVDLDVPEDSALLSKMAGQGHGGGAIFDDRSSEYDLILTWIEQGAAP